VAYLIAGGHNAQKAVALPTRVLSTQAISLVSAGPRQPGGAAAALTLLDSRSGLGFTAAGQGGADWTADQMAGGTYIFIYLPDGLCLAEARASAVVLRRCDLQAGQRWIRQHPQAGAAGLDYWQLRNLSGGGCVTASGADGSAARLERCQVPAGWRQLIALLTAS